MPYSLLNWTPAFIRRAWNNELQVNETESTLWKHAKQVLKGGSLLLTGVLGYSWLKGTWSGNTAENNLSQLAERNLPYPNIPPSTLTNPFDQSINLNLQYPPKISSLKINTVTDELTTLTQRNLAKRVALGSEFQINNYTLGDQTNPSISRLTNGNVVVAWYSFNQTGTGTTGIYAQTLSPLGGKIGSEFQVKNDVRTGFLAGGFHSNVYLTALNNSYFFVTYASPQEANNQYGIYGQQFDALGNKVGNEVHINSDALNLGKFNPSIASQNDGTMLVTWQRRNPYWNIYGQLFDINLAKYGGEFLFSNYTLNDQYDAIATSVSNNTFLVVWNRVPVNGTVRDIYGRLLNDKGTYLDNEFKANTDTIYDKPYPNCAGLVNGNFVIVWQSFAQDGDDYGIYGQLFDSTGNKLNNEFKINTYTPSSEADAAVVGLIDGSFLVAWNSFGAQDGSKAGVFGQIFNVTAGKVGSEFQINIFTAEQQNFPALATLPNGNVMAVWQSNGQDGSGRGIYGKVVSTQLSATNLNQVANYLKSTNYDFKDIVITLPAYAANLTANLRLSDPLAGQLTTGTSGVTTAIYNSTTGIWRAAGPVEEVNNLLASLQFIPAINFRSNANLSVILDDGVDASLTSFIPIIGDEFQVNVNTLNDQHNAAIAALSNGNFVVAWQSYDQDGSEYNIYSRIFAADSIPLTPEISVNINLMHYQTYPGIAALNNGGFVIAWSGNFENNITNSDYGVYARIFTADGVPLTSEIHINTYVTGDQGNPTAGAIVASKNGNFMVSWASQFQDGSDYGVYGRIFSSNGTILTQEIPINNYTIGTQDFPGVIALNNDDFVVTWNSRNDGRGNGIYSRIFSSIGTIKSDEIRINPSKSGGSINTAVLSNGNFVVSWYNRNSSYVNIYARMFTATGNAISNESLLNTSPISVDLTFKTLASSRSLTALNNGFFVAAWPNIQVGVYARVFTADVIPISKEVKLNSYASNLQERTGVTKLNNGNFVVIWESVGQDGSGLGVYGKIIDTHLYAANTHQTIIYTENVPYNLTAIVVKPAIFIDTLSASLQLSNSSAGRLTTGTSNNVTSLFNVNQGLWQAAGAVNDVNNLLANLTFQPTQYYNGNFTIKVSVNDGFNAPLNDIIAVQGIAVNQPPVIENNQLTIEQGQKVILNRSNLSATDVDSDNAALIFTVNNVKEGQFGFIDDPRTAITSFTQQQIQEGKVIFVHNGSPDSPFYKVSVSDGQLSIVYTPANIAFIPKQEVKPPVSDNTAIIAGSVVGGTVAIVAAATTFGLFKYAHKNKKWCFKPTHPDDVEIAELSRPGFN